MRVIEVIPTIIGESTFTGWSCVLIRLAGCDVHCSWCDTRWAWNIDSGYEIDGETLVSFVHLCSGKAVVGDRYFKHILITGGEPLLQQDEVLKLTDVLTRDGFTVVIETSGQHKISKKFNKLKHRNRVHFVVDVKPPSSGVEIKKDVLEHNLKVLRPELDEFKIVIKDFNDFMFAIVVIEKYLHNQKKRFPVSLSPLHDVLDPKTLFEWILKECLDVRLNLQIHKYIEVP